MIEKSSLEQAGQVIIVDSVAKISNRYNQIPYLTWNTICKRDRTTRNHNTQKTKRSALSQQVITRLQGTKRQYNKDKHET